MTTQTMKVASLDADRDMSEKELIINGYSLYTTQSKATDAIRSLSTVFCHFSLSIPTVKMRHWRPSPFRASCGSTATLPPPRPDCQCVLQSEHNRVPFPFKELGGAVGGHAASPLQWRWLVGWLVGGEKTTFHPSGFETAARSRIPVLAHQCERIIISPPEVHTLPAR